MSREAYERGKLEGAGLRDAWKSAAKRWRRSYQALAQRVDSHWDRWPDIVAELRAEGAAEERERCANIAANEYRHYPTAFRPTWYQACREIAKACRKRFQACKCVQTLKVGNNPQGRVTMQPERNRRLWPLIGMLIAGAFLLYLPLSGLGALVWELMYRPVLDGIDAGAPWAVTVMVLVALVFVTCGWEAGR